MGQKLFKLVSYQITFAAQHLRTYRRCLLDMAVFVTWSLSSAICRRRRCRRRDRRYMDSPSDSAQMERDHLDSLCQRRSLHLLRKRQEQGYVFNGLTK